jgi:hypothetical protein
MTPESPIQQPSPEKASGCRVSPESVLPQSGCGVSPRAVPGASRSESASPFPHPPTHSHPSPSFDDMGLVYPPEMPAEANYDGDYDSEDDARERELLYHDLASDNDDYTRSDEDGWFYSDEG